MRNRHIKAVQPEKALLLFGLRKPLRRNGEHRVVRVDPRKAEQLAVDERRHGVAHRKPDQAEMTFFHLETPLKRNN